MSTVPGETTLQTRQVLGAVAAERRRQDEKWGHNRSLSDLLWMTILNEETGEVARAILENQFGELREELVQVAAVAVAWIEDMDRRRS